MAERNAIAKVTFPDDSETQAQWTFKDQANAVVVDLKEFSSEMIRKLARHGLKQKLADSYAGAKGDVKVALESFNETLSNLKQGIWATRVAGEGGAKVTQLVEALVRVSGKSVDDCKAVISKLGEQDEADEGSRVSALRKHPKIALALAQIKVERATAAAAKEGTPDIGALLQ